MAKGRMIFSSLCPTWLRLLGLIGLGVYGCAPAQAQQFSADLVTTDVGGTATASAGRLRVFNDKVRIETAEFADGFFLIVDRTVPPILRGPPNGFSWMPGNRAG
jgi:hypothetical protein